MEFAVAEFFADREYWLELVLEMNFLIRLFARISPHIKLTFSYSAEYENDILPRVGDNL